MYFKCETMLNQIINVYNIKGLNQRFQKLGIVSNNLFIKHEYELKTFEWWISGLMLNPLFFLISRLNMACCPHEFNLQISQQIEIKNIPF